MYFTWYDNHTQTLLIFENVFYVVWMYVEFVPNTGTYVYYTRKQIFCGRIVSHNLVL